MAARKSIIGLGDVRMSGPLFDGQAQVAVVEWLETVKLEVGQTGADWIRIAALSMDKSGRGGTGHAAEAVRVSKLGLLSDVVIFGGMVKGQVWWPWLEGDSRRNVKSRFKGYHTFRLTRLRLRRYVTPYAQARLSEFIDRMGGRVA